MLQSGNSTFPGNLYALSHLSVGLALVQISALVRSMRSLNLKDDQISFVLLDSLLLDEFLGEILGVGEWSYTGALSSPPAEASLPDSEVSLRLGYSLSFSVAL